MPFSTYLHLEEKVPAIQCNATNQKDIAQALSVELKSGMLASLAATYNTTHKTYEYIFRYKNQTVDSTLSVSDYLVQLNTGNYITRTEKEFLEEYFNCGVDIVIPLDKQQNPKQALVTFIRAYFPQAGITDVSQLTPEALKVVSNGLKNWYNEETNIFYVKFTDCALTDPTGLADLLLAFPAADFVNNETRFIINFDNGCFADTVGNHIGNLFNVIALQQLIGELRKLDENLLKRLVGMTFMNYRQNDPTVYNPIASSVSDERWMQFVADMVDMTGINAGHDIKRS